MSKKRIRYVSLFCKEDEEACKQFKPNPEVEDVVYEIDLLLDERILLPVLAVFISMQKMDKFLIEIGYTVTWLSDKDGKDKSLNDIVSMLNAKEEIEEIKRYISVNDIIKTFNSIMKEIEEEREENDINGDINTLLDIILKIFNQFEDNNESNNLIGLFELYRKLEKIFPYNMLKEHVIDYKIAENDSFVEIINSLGFNNKYLEYQSSNKVFQFPQNKIYIRDCYITYYSKIWNYINSSPDNKNVIILGQPGIGKTSFIYYILFMLKNDLSTRYFLEDDYGNKGVMVEKLNELLIAKNIIENDIKDIKENKIKSEIILTKIDILEKKIDDMKHVPIIDNYRKSIEDCKKLIDAQIEVIAPKENEIGKIPFRDYKPMIIFYNQMNKIYASVSDGKELKPFKTKLQQFIDIAVYVYTEIDKRIKEKQTQCKKLQTEYENKLKEIEKEKNECNKDSTSQTEYENKLKEIEKENERKNKINECKKKLEEEIIKLNNNANIYNDFTEWNEELEELKKKEILSDEEFNKNINKNKEEKQKLTKEIQEISKTFDHNYSSSVDLVNEIIGNKDIFVVKSVKGNNTKRVYTLINGKLALLENAKANKINNSIVITDTYGDIDKSNIIISISSPDNENFQKYEEEKYHKIMYLDSFSDEEMEEWYLNCIDNSIPDGFGDVCKMYGNVTRQVNFHFLYKNNYHKNYWEYYKQLINSVIGTIGFDYFLSKYIPENKLKENPLSNIIMKYDLEYKEGELEPKKSLIFVSPKIGMYVSSMLFPPKNNDDYIKILKYYRLNNDSNIPNNSSIPDDSSIHDKSIDRMLLKQIAGYKIALGEMKIKEISKYNIEVERNSSSFSYFPFNAIEEIIYILDEDNIFDFILNGVFIKILHKDKGGDDYGDNNNDMKELNRLLGSNDKLKEIKDKYIKSNDNTIKYSTIKEDEIINSINGNTIGEIKSNDINQPTSNINSEITNWNCYNEIKRTVENNPSDFLIALNIIKDESLINYQFVLDNLEEFALFLKKGNEYYYYKNRYGDINNRLPYTLTLEGRKYKYLKCYEEMIYIIERNLKNDGNQKNYLIFGNEGIGKTVLADFLNDYFIKYLDRDFNILLIQSDKGNSIYNYCEKGEIDSHFIQEITPTRPYIVISDEVVVGEDEYSDARMVIVIGNSSDEKIKTYQSKRCPLIMYIPPFTEEEIKFISKNNDVENDKIKKYGCIPYYFSKDENAIKIRIIKELRDENKNKIAIEMLNGEPKSPLSKGYSSKICIYNTFENDVTKSTRLIFLSDEVREIVYQNCINLDVVNNTRNIFDTYEEQPHGDLAGKIFERLILYLCEKSEKFQNLLLEYYALPEGFRILYKKITDENDLTKEIGKMKVYLKDNTIPLFDLSYNSSFPDVDFLLCFIGVQITVGLTHSLSAEIIDMLNGWKELIKTEIETEYRNEGIPSPQYLNDLFNNDLKYMVISNNRNVDLNYRKVKEQNKFPSVLLKYINKTRIENNDRRSVEEINSKKEMMYISYKLLKVMVNETL